MALYYRIIHRKHAETPNNYGLGGGRWNPSNTPIIYAGSSVAITMMEFLSILGSVVVKSDWSLITFDILGEIPHLEADGLPTDWDSRPYPLSTQRFGRDWTSSKISLCIKVPSSRIPLKFYPQEHNLLINPLHADFSSNVKVKHVDPLHFHLNEWATGDR
jgi:RES domain-containing protein